MLFKPVSDAPRLFVFETPHVTADDTAAYREFVKDLPLSKKVFDRERLRETVSAMVRHHKAPSFFPWLYPGVEGYALQLQEHREILNHYKLQATNMAVYLKHEGVQYGVVCAPYAHYWHNHMGDLNDADRAILMDEYQKHFQQVFEGIRRVRIVVQNHYGPHTETLRIAGFNQHLYEDTVLVTDTPSSGESLLHTYVYPYWKSIV